MKKNSVVSLRTYKQLNTQLMSIWKRIHIRVSWQCRDERMEQRHKRSSLDPRSGEAL